MEDQAKMERLLRLLMLLSSGVKHTRQEDPKPMKRLKPFSWQGVPGHSVSQLLN